MSAPVDVLAGLELAACGCTAQGNQMAANELLDIKAAVAELIEQMRDVLALWDSNGMSIDGNAATMQCRPEKWRTALANVGSAS